MGYFVGLSKYHFLKSILGFKARGTGHVINLGSVAGREPYAGGSIYCATKHAVRAFTGALMRELVDTPIRVTEIQPGMVETEFSNTRYRGDNAAAKNVYKGLEPCERFLLVLHLGAHWSLHSGGGGYRGGDCLGGFPPASCQHCRGLRASCKPGQPRYRPSGTMMAYSTPIIVPLIFLTESRVPSIISY